MALKLFTKCQAETRRLIWIIGLMFTLVLIFQYFELPYGIFLPSIFPSAKVPVVEESSLQNADLLPNYKIIGDNSSLSNNTHSTQVNDTRISGSISEESLGLDEGNTTGKEYLSGDLERQNKTEKKTENLKDVDNGLPQEEAKQPELTFHEKINTTNISFSNNETTITTSDQNGTSFAGSPTPANSNTSLVEKKENSEPEHTELKQKDNSSSMTTAPQITNKPKTPVLDVYSLSDMNKMLLQSQASYYSVIPKWPSAAERELQAVTLQIENAPIVMNDPKLYAPLYKNISTFKRSYELMEQTLKVYIYKEGDRPILHTPVLTGLYASEGWFMKQMENNKQFVTKNAKKAHLFYLPFSSRMLEETLYVVDSHSHKNLIQFLKNYVNIIAAKYPYWNRTGGADHFLVACHDWAPSETKQYMGKCIRALCNADVKEGFVFGKDVSLPETYVHLPKDPLRNLGGKPASKRSTLAFFAGSMHGYVRPILLQHWQDKDPDMKIFGKLPKKKGNKVYVNYMKSSKYCICAKGYEVNSPRVVEAIFYDCVPVIISDNFVPPFIEVLNWESFAVFVLEKDIPNLKNILLSIPDKRYRRMQMMVKKVQKHFLWNPKPVKYDIFHMLLHSIWHNRLHQIRPI
ncbi:probable glycosyltransferase At5g03795 [Humulus lupulus]|uniref:probable glycosyltransferase At5g03795 n=1 Tax=Humulus lupulus TaxID=3486 RepID=UPI002B40E66A|nr:probable glycosyltransferase At5g03795 [Humulus lupulus]XP_062100956.1 probable glycosyltransferase At5g03795 [Humulus lupulus]XP_062100957.1 probable glycosyltransferase At5g03795 [Humulus lupulus]XP_062100958.1 probable glycosyltransferase At5g03795 [Humulus lupulus]XP_062100959.1 probable glycosyltransferase At5g03795 [Humulus lupulus]XP_062100961.1 probable glycosyltransferase At5g03795 [Humulus lupulus]XP_062100962.1 probable glycosyltransferase At5g03795 [Humulus lupulus]XP_06210096